MTDLISRQAAIDELKRISFSHWFECGEYLSEDVREIKIINSNKALEAIEELPSAEPQWIPCSERLPQALEEVFVTSKYGHVYTSRIVHGEFEYGGEVIAWMPLPKPYKRTNMRESE